MYVCIYIHTHMYMGSLDVASARQEFMILPVGAGSFREALQIGAEAIAKTPSEGEYMSIYLSIDRSIYSSTYIYVYIYIYICRYVHI